MSAPRVIDVHCECGHVFVSSENMVPLSTFAVRPELSGFADRVFIAMLAGQPIMTADFICPNCGKMTYFRLDEQKLNLLLDRVMCPG